MCPLTFKISETRLRERKPAACGFLQSMKNGPWSSCCLQGNSGPYQRSGAGPFCFSGFIGTDAPRNGLSGHTYNKPTVLRFQRAPAARAVRARAVKTLLSGSGASFTKHGTKSLRDRTVVFRLWPGPEPMLCRRKKPRADKTNPVSFFWWDAV